jgi:hypothetical protein
VATKKPTKGSSSARPSSREAKAQRLVDSGQYATVQEAKRAIYRKEYEGRNAKAKREHFKDYSAKRSRQEEIKRKLEYGEWQEVIESIKEFSEDPEMETALWQMFRSNYKSSKG